MVWHLLHKFLLRLGAGSGWLALSSVSSRSSLCGGGGGGGGGALFCSSSCSCLCGGGGGGGTTCAALVPDSLLAALVAALVAGLVGIVGGGSCHRSSSSKMLSRMVGGPGLQLVLGYQRCSGVALTSFQSLRSLVVSPVSGLVPVIWLCHVLVTTCGVGSHGPLVVVGFSFLL